jgi:hypothetical protein
MKGIYILIFILKVFTSFSQGPFDTLDLIKIKDLLFIENVKKNAIKEFGFELKGDFYCKWKENNEPYFLMYVSRADTVACAPNTGGMDKGIPYAYLKDEKDYTIFSGMQVRMGMQPFLYKGYANATTEMNDRFVSYDDPAKCFIIYHELLHNYVSQNNLKIPYDIHEALCDVVGNYGALYYAQNYLKMDIGLTQEEIDICERIYECVNESLISITPRNKNVALEHSGCFNKIQNSLRSAGTFQHDRFSYEVNNGFLLKVSNYSRNYFLLKRVLQKQGSIFKLLEIIKANSGKNDYLLYLEQFT